MKTDASQGPNPIDQHVGSRIRERRKELGMSQERLADHLGLTFQQVQKYERGSNRVSASKLFEISKALKSHVAFFFEHLSDAEETVDGDSPGSTTEFRHDFIMTPEGTELAKAFPRIKQRKVRRQLLELVKALASQDGPPEPDET